MVGRSWLIQVMPRGGLLSTWTSSTLTTTSAAFDVSTLPAPGSAVVPLVVNVDPDLAASLEQDSRVQGVSVGTWSAVGSEALPDLAWIAAWPMTFAQVGECAVCAQ